MVWLGLASCYCGLKAITFALAGLACFVNLDNMEILCKLLLICIRRHLLSGIVTQHVQYRDAIQMTYNL